jgi:hypothetical protein
VIVESTPIIIPAMAGVLRCCDECGDDPTAGLEGELVDEVVADEDVVVELEDGIEDVRLRLEFVSGVNEDELVSEVVAELVGDVVSVN